MRRDIQKGVGIFFVLVLAVIVWTASGISVREWWDTWSIPDDPDELVLFSVDGSKLDRPREERGHPEGVELLYECPVLGRGVITAPEQRRQVIAAAKEAIRAGSPTQSKCFYPRHVLRVVNGGRALDVVICFQCHNYLLYRDGHPPAPLTPSIGKQSEPLLNKVLADAGVPLAAK